MARSICLASLVCLIFASNSWGQRLDVWNDPRVEAEYLAVEITGELRPPVRLADQIQADLAAIRSAFPDFADVRVLPDWMPGEVLAGLTASAYSDFKHGSFTGFDHLYATLGIPETRAHDFGQWVHLQFGQVYHGVRLAELFQPVSGVRYAEPNGIAGDGNDIVARLDRTYTFSRGFGDCPAGCIYRESWNFTVTDDAVFQGTLAEQTQPVSGDFNDDGAVDAADYTVWRDELGSIYDDSHYSDWKNNFGATPVRGSETVAGASVPEPTGRILALFGLLLAGLRCDRKGWELLN